jgi:hypothetical protein
VPKPAAAPVPSPKPAAAAAAGAGGFDLAPLLQAVGVLGVVGVGANAVTGAATKKVSAGQGQLVHEDVSHNAHPGP